jgi:Na+/citrate or Na+/malate symporter
LQKASFNMNKQKYDFLHFYVKNSIVTSSIVGLEWRIRIKSLKGNLLIGICSSLSSNSIDLVMNKYGEIKKKEIN